MVMFIYFLIHIACGFFQIKVSLLDDMKFSWLKVRLQEML